MSYEPPTPPAELPTDVVNTLNDYSPDQLQHVARYTEELAEHKARESRLEEESDETFEMIHESISAETNGMTGQIYLEGYDECHLQGTRTRLEFTQSELLAFLDRAKAPVIYDGELYWSEELVEGLGN
jgi:hypothetical protein